MLRLLLSSRQLAAASTDCAAKAVKQVEDSPILGAISVPRAKRFRSVNIHDNIVKQGDMDTPPAPMAAVATKAAKKSLRDMFLGGLLANCVA